MSVRVLIPTPLRGYTDKRDTLVLEGRTVHEVLEKLFSHYSGLKRHLLTDDGKLRSFVNIYLNDEDIRFLQKERTPVKENDVLSIIPSIAGGRT
ncbi:MAG: MoaD/ThiS family protein [Bacteroidota bacterium]|jgi:molybdopterin converting factor small subunit